MRYDRRSTRLKGYDYSRAGWYYVTMCTWNRVLWLGTVAGNETQRSALGETVHKCWLEIPMHHAGVTLDEFVVMPDHLHGIVVIGSNNQHVRRDVQLNVPTSSFSTISPKRGSLSVIIRTFKGAVVTWARKNGYSAFRWQGRFYEHIIRNDADLYRIRRYIQNNPLQWALGEDNPEN